MKQRQKKIIRYLPAALVCFAIILAGLLAMLMNQWFDEDDVKKKKVVQQITVISPPPPPPPPPEKIKEPEIEEEVIEEDMEESMPEEGPEEFVGEELGLDADGTAGGDGFGLVAKKGGRGFLGGGGYSSAIKAEINKALLKDKTLRGMAYEAIVTLWVEEDGSFLRFDIEIITGQDFTRDELARVIDEMGGMNKPKPLEEKANRFRFKITSVI